MDTFYLFALAVCKKQQADLVFLLDQSGSISSDDYKTMKNFTTAVINSFKVSKEFVRVGLAQFSNTFQHEFYLNQFYGEQVIAKHVSDMQQLGGGTKIGLALESIRDYFEASRGSRRSQKISQNLVLITDGESEDDVEEAAIHLRALGVEVFAIGVGNVHHLELLQITGTPERLFTVQNFGSLENIQQKVVDKICESEMPEEQTGEFKSLTYLHFSHRVPLPVMSKTRFPLPQAAALTSPWASTFPKELDILWTLWSVATPSSSSTCQRSPTTFPH